MIRESAPGRAAIRYYNPYAYERRRPLLIARNFTGEPPIAIDLPHEASDIPNRALHLDDQDGSSARVPCEDVDRSTFAEDRERHLRLDNPFGQARESANERLDHTGVASVDEPVEIAASPAGNDVDPCIHGAEYTPQHSQGRGVDAAVLEA